jgi:hypothetical protein
METMAGLMQIFNEWMCNEKSGRRRSGPQTSCLANTHLIAGYLDVLAFERIDHESSPRVVQPVNVDIPEVKDR